MKKAAGGGSLDLLYWYGLGGEVLVETTLTKTATDEYVYFNGQRLTGWQFGSGLYFYLSDHLGSTRALVRAWQYAPCSDSDFLPFGFEKNYLSACSQNYKFTGQERDGETGLDYFIARHYGSTIGRFLQIDPANAGASLNNPQSWNAYAYSFNNPLRFVDPTGLEGQCGTADDPKCQHAENADKSEDEQRRRSAAEQLGDLQVDGDLINPFGNSGFGDFLYNFFDGPNIALASRDLVESETTQGKIGAGTAFILLIGINAVPGGGKAGSKLGKGAAGLIERHHRLPKQFADWFAEKGLNVNDFVRTLSAGRHRLNPSGIHTSVMSHK